MKDIRILIADDDKEIRDLLKRYLERELYMVDTAINGEEALHLFNQNVFERMYRSEQSRNSSLGGSGLGLSICKALVEKNSGHIWVDSIPWERTTFGFSIPKHTTFKK
ncbi:hypothetical protein CN425_26985 [Bacillus cereus]|uniref:histidine kinase n=1 Tax=Bacillus cereus TaxID=1396 RepID=A0A2A8PPM0_BACCE|nr:hypothetical protein ICY_04364 [Bacillus cereus BAG2X1-3]PEV95179.1 hypothetical protein CN425_26985 [Bacillus cereus]